MSRRVRSDEAPRREKCPPPPRKRSCVRKPSGHKFTPSPKTHEQSGSGDGGFMCRVSGVVDGFVLDSGDASGLGAPAGTEEQRSRTALTIKCGGRQGAHRDGRCDALPCDVVSCHTKPKTLTGTRWAGHRPEARCGQNAIER